MDTTPLQWLFDASTTLFPPSGIGRYTLELLRALIAEQGFQGAKEKSPLNKSFSRKPAPIIWMNSLRRAPWASRHGFLWRAESEGHVQVKHTRWPGPALLAGWQWLDAPCIEDITQSRPQVIHSPASVVPSVRKAKCIVTVHDCYALRQPGHSHWLGGGYLAAALPKRLPLADAVIVPSDAVRRELLRLIPALPATRIHAIPEGVNHQLFRPSPPVMIQEALQRRKIHTPYILTVATLEPRKNLARLFAALAMWRRRAQPGHEPVLVGVGGPGWGKSSLDDLFQQSGLERRAVRWLGRVNDKELALLYGGARVVAIPSLWEGFGLPVLEAMACGRPVLAANVGGLPEVLGDTGAYADPLDAGAMSRALEELFEAPAEWREALGRRALERAASFTWSAAARRTLEVYKAVCPQ